MARPTAMDELFVHQIPELLPDVVDPQPALARELLLRRPQPDRRRRRRVLHDGPLPGAGAHGLAPDGPGRRRAGPRRASSRPYDGDPHTTEVAAAPASRSSRPWEEIRLWADPAVAPIGLDLTFTRPHPALRAAPGHHARRPTTSSGTSATSSSRAPTTGTYTVGGDVHAVDGWIGQRDHSWGIRDHGRCPLWMWFQIQFDDGFLGVWHWELANGARVYTDGCWAGTDGGDPVPVVDFAHEIDLGRRRRRAGASTASTATTSPGSPAPRAFTLADGRRDHRRGRGHLRPALRAVPPRRPQPDDRRAPTTAATGTAIYEVTGARHHRYFPDTTVDGSLPT